MEWKGKLLVLILVISFVSISLPSISRGQSGPLAIPEIYIELDKEIYDCSVEPDVSDRETYVTGKLWCKIPSSISEGTGCTVVLIPKIAFFDINGETEFKFTRSDEVADLTFIVIVEEGYNANSKQILQIGGIWEYDRGYGDGEVNPASCVIKALPYGSVDLSIPLEMGYTVTVKEGKESSEVLWIRNLGNSEDMIKIEIITEMKGITVVPDQDLIGMTGGSSRRLYIKIIAEDGAKGSGLVTIRATTTHPGVNNVDEVPLTLIVKEKEEEAVNLMMGFTLFLLVFGLILLIIIGLLTRSRKKKNG